MRPWLPGNSPMAPWGAMAPSLVTQTLRWTLDGGRSTGHVTWFPVAVFALKKAPPNAGKPVGVCFRV